MSDSQHLDSKPLRNIAAVCLGLVMMTSAALAQHHHEPPATLGSSADDSSGQQTEIPEREPEVVRAFVQGPPGNRHVRSIRPFRPGGGRVDWSQQGDWIAFDQKGDRGVYEIYLMNVLTEAERCLTCDQYDLRKTHSLSPAWHPSGDYLVFVVQNRPRRARLDSRELVTANRGLHGDVWAITRDGKDAWQLTQIAANGGAVIDPHFSYEADRLVWSERMESRRGRWGYWALQIAEFRIKRGLPRLGKVERYDPPLPRGFVVAHGFTPNDRGLMLSAAAGDAEYGGRDILRFDLESRSVDRLTGTSEHHDDQAFVSPRSDRIVWASDRNIDPPRRPRLPFRGDLWFMSERDRIQERLTFFNDPESDHYLGEALIGDITWSPEGDKVLLQVVHVADPPADAEPLEIEPEEGPRASETLYMVELDETFTR